MQVIVSGHKVDVGESLSRHIEDRLQSTLSKYSDRINKVNVVVTKEGHEFRVDISGNIGTHAGITLQSRVQSADAYDAVDVAAAKVEKQLRRYKRQITNHHTKIDKKEQTLSGMHYVISAEEEQEEIGDNPLIIAENATHIERLTIPDAVMRMDLGDLPALMFINDATEKMNMIYRRHDGHIAWVAPEVAASNSKDIAA